MPQTPPDTDTIAGAPPAREAVPDSGTDTTAIEPADTRPASPPRGPQHHSALAAFSARHRWWVLLVSTLGLAGSILLLSGGITTQSQSDQLVGDSARAIAITEAADFGQQPTEHVIMTAKSGALTPSQISTLGRELTTAYEGVEGVSAVGEPFPGADGRSVVLPVELRATTREGDTSLPAPEEVVAPSLAVTERLAAVHPDLAVGQYGPGSEMRELNTTLGDDFRRAEIFSIPITLVILLIAFGAVVAAGVPLILGIGSVAGALGLTALASREVVAVDPNAQSLILLIGLAVGVDYALFIMRRVREERAAGADVPTAISVAGATAGRAVIISGITVIVAMSGMLVAGGLFTSLALGAMLVVAVAVLASATALPAILAILGDKVEALRLPFSKRRAARSGSVDSLWGRLAGRVSSAPKRWGAAALLVLVAMSIPALGMKTSLGGVETLPSDLQVVTAYRQLEAAVPTDGTALQVVVKAAPDQADRVGQALVSLGEEARGLEHVSGVAPEVQVSSDGTVSTLGIGVAMDPSDERLSGVVQTVRDELVPDLRTALAETPGATTPEVHVGGIAAATDLASWMDDRLPWVVGFVLLLTLLVMVVSFGSPWLAVATVLLNVLSVGAAYGVMTMVFQGQWAEGLLDFTSSGAIAAWLPMLMFVVLFGLSMDYHIFVTSRVREARDAGHDPRTAVRLGLARSAGVVTSAAAVMIGVFSVFGTLSSLEMKQLGVGLATAILLDATIVRGVLLPAVLSVLGDRAHRGPRWLPTIHH